MKPRLLVVLAALALVACEDKPPTDGSLDTDLADTDTLDESDTSPPETDPPDSDSDVETDTDTHTGEVLSVTIPGVRQSSLALPGDMVSIADVIVTGVRQDGTAFVIQDRVATSSGGMVVTVDLGDTLPETGDVVTVVGRYAEIGAPGAQRPFQTTATVVTGAAVPGSGVTVTGGASPPAPKVLAYNANIVGNSELYESMLVRVGGDLVVAGAADVDGSFELAPPVGAVTGTKPLPIGAWFVSPSAGLADFGEGASFDTIGGIVAYDGGWTVEPVSAADLVGYTAPNTDTDPHTADSDTAVFCDSDGCDSDTAAPPTEVTGTPQNIHNGLYTADETMVTLEDVVVTAVRDGANNTDAFTIQSTDGASIKAGIYIDAGDTQSAGVTLPAVGDLVTVRGLYKEYNTLGASQGVATQSRLVANSQIPGLASTGWTVTGTAALPTPIEVSVAQFQVPNTMESYESMRVTLVDLSDLTVREKTPVPKIGLSTGTDRVWLEPTFYDIYDDYIVNVGSTMTSVTGIVIPKIGATSGLVRLAPVSSADIVGYVQ